MKPLKATLNTQTKIEYQQLRGLFILAREYGKSPDDVAEISKSMGYKSRKDILQKDIKEIEEKIKSSVDKTYYKNITGL